MSAQGHEHLDTMRHSTAHIMAKAVQRLYPGTRLAIGPIIENGFYYDLDAPQQIGEPDLARIEEEMARIIAADEPFVRIELARDAALAHYTTVDPNPMKVKIIRDLPEDEAITFYKTGEDWMDLCHGPHVASASEAGAFKLTSVAGAYWRGDERNPMLTRLYGTAWPTTTDLADYLARLEEARARDHRKLGRDLDLFAFSDDVGPGIPMFLPKGEMLRHTMETYVRDLQTRHGYQHVWTANVVREELYRKSGHLEAYSDVMFPPMIDDDVRMRLKPMNCPSHMTLYNTRHHSYRDLPLRYAEFATLYRYEKSGELSGLTRVRSLTQDDAHTFCTPDQIEPEFGLALALIRETLQTYGLTDYRVRLSLRVEGDGGKYIGDPAQWNQATEALRAALNANGVDYETAYGEAAMYGPKADFLAKDALGREWQLSTIQVDFVQPGRLGCVYIAEDGSEHTPVLLHRAVTGATERFLGVLVEHYAGAFPLWLAPVQVVVVPIADRHVEYGRTVQQTLAEAGLRVEVDARNERMNAKIRDAQLQKVPYMLIVGDREAEASTVSLRPRHGDEEKGVPLATVVARLATEVRHRVITP